MTTFQKTTSAVLLFSALVAAGCSGATANTAGAGGDAAAAAAASQAGASLGIKDTLVQVAVTAAKNWLANKVGATPAQGTKNPVAEEDKTEAAKQGVDAAVTEAKKDGTELTQTQQTGLMDVLKRML